MSGTQGPPGAPGEIQPAPVGLDRRLRRSLSHGVVASMAKAAGRMPRWLARAMFAAIGALGFALLGRDRRRMQEHAGRALGLDRRARRRFVRRAFIELGLNAADVFRMLRRPPSELLRLIEVEGEEHLERAIDEGRGVVAVTGHIGAWELVSGYLVQRGFRVAVVARTLKDARYDALVRRLRDRLGVVALAEEGDLRPAFRTLRAGGILGLVIDQDRRWPGTWVPFLGGLAHLPAGPAEFARRTGARILPMGLHRRGSRHRLTVLPAIEADWRRPGAVSAVTASLGRALESLIWRRPEQWTWMYDPWTPAMGEVERRPMFETARRRDVEMQHGLA